MRGNGEDEAFMDRTCSLRSITQSHSSSRKVWRPNRKHMTSAGIIDSLKRHLESDLSRLDPIVYDDKSTDGSKCKCRYTSLEEFMVFYGYPLPSLNRINASKVYRIEIINSSVLLAKEQHRHRNIVPANVELATAIKETELS